MRASAPARASARKRPFEYLLGDSPAESARLERQARLWDPEAEALFDRLAVRPGWRVLEVGPGRGSVHMALRRRLQGPLDAVERSEVFVRALRERCREDGLGEGRIFECDLLDAPLPPGAYDLIYARWVFLFLPRPDLHVRKLVRALRPGGRLAVQDYGHRGSLALHPRPEEWPDFLAADRAFYDRQQGDVSVAGRLPGLFRKAGLSVVAADPMVKVGRPGSEVWAWIFDYFTSVRPRLEAVPPLDRAKAARLWRHWRAAARDPQSFVIAPTVVSLVGRKAGRRPRTPSAS